MLHGVATLMGSHGGSGDAVAVINRLTEVDGLSGWVVVVGQMSRCRGYPYIIDTVVTQHLLCNISSRHAIGHGYFRIFLELALQAGRNQPTQ